MNGDRIFLTSLPFDAHLAQNTDDVLLGADRAAIASGRSVVSDLFRGRTTGHMFIAIDQAILSEGKAAALLTIAIPPIRLQTVLLEQVKTGWLFGVTDNNGQLIARTWEFDRFVGQKASSSFLERTSGAGGDFINVSLDGVSVYNVWRRSPLTGWRMSVGIPTAELEGPVRQSILGLLSLTGSGILTSLLLAWIYGGALVRRVKVLELYARSVGKRDENVPIAKSGIAEVDAVIQSLTETDLVLKKHDQVRDSLIGELNHRVKNTLAVIQSISRQTRKRSTSLDEFGSAFEGRLMALARSHEALTRSGWFGSNFSDVVRAACGPFTEDERIDIAGPDIELHSGAVVNIAMVLHELATNAAKYGALSTMDGRIAISWRIEPDGNQDLLHFEWKESKGPSIGSFEKKGFGSLLISSIIQHDLDGQSTFFPETDGVRFVAVIPLKRLAASSTNT